MPKNYYNIIKLLQSYVSLQYKVKYLFKKIEIVEEEKITLSDELKNTKCLHNNQSKMLTSQLEQCNKRRKELTTEVAHLNSLPRRKPEESSCFN